MKRISFLLPLVALASAFGLSGCALMHRAPGSGYAYRSDSDFDMPTSRREREVSERDNLYGELGINGSQELTPQQRSAVESRMALKQEERALVGRREKEQYYRYKPLLKNDRERIEFLRIGTYEGRQRWLQAKGISSSAERHPAEYVELIEQNDITLGMTKQAVRESWGDPDLVEVAGNPLYGNERWNYKEYVTSAEGYQAENRVVYFESGRVVGWETR